MRKLIAHCTIVMCVLLQPFVSVAQTDSVVERSVEAVNVEAQKFQRSAMPVQTFTAIDIQQQSVQNVADIMRQFKGTNVKDYGGVGGLKTVSVRSMGAAHTAVNYDGVFLSDCQAGPIDVGRFNIDNIETITLAVGQTDELLQPARAFASAAVLSINSRKNDFIDNKLKIDAVQKVGSFAYTDTKISLAKKLTTKNIVSVCTDFMRADGQYKFSIPNGKHTIRGYRRNSDINSAYAELNINTRDSNRFENQIKAYGFYSERGLPGVVIFYNSAANERLWDKNFFVQDDGKWRLSNNATIRFQAKYNYSWNRYEDVNVMYANGKRTDLNTQHEGYFSLSGLYNFQILSVALSGDMAYNTLKSNMMNNPQPCRMTLISALNVRVAVPHFSAIGTLVATHITEKVDFGSHPEDIKRISPAFNIKWYNNYLTLRAMAKETFRVPTFNELYYTTLGTTGLKPEKAHELNIGGSFCTETFGLSVDAFANKIENKIVAIPTMYVWKMSNYGEVEILGADISIDKDFEIADFQLKTKANYSYQRAIDVTDKKSKLYKSQIPYTPLHSGNFSAMLLYNKTSLSINAFFSGKRYFLEYNIKDNEIKPYLELSATISQSFQVKNCKIDAKFSCLNITNKQYCVIQYYPMPGRHFQLQANLTL